MKISFILNGEDVSLEADSGLRLVDILRNSFELRGSKNGCNTGICGTCSVILNGELVKSCLVPAFKVRNSEIITFEGFSQTDEYMDFALGFREAGFDNCSFCMSGKILAAEALLTRNPRPSRNDILRAFQGTRCRCTGPENLVRAVTAVIEHRRRRINEASSERRFSS